jgi:hypothetical protein
MGFVGVVAVVVVEWETGVPDFNDEGEEEGAEMWEGEERGSASRRMNVSSEG